MLRGVVQRYLPTESQHLLALTVVVGVVCGLVAVAFHMSVRAAERALFDRAISAEGIAWIPWTLAVPTVGGLLVGMVLTWYAPGARGSGVPQVKSAFAFQGGRIPLRDSVAKFLLSVAQIGSGASLGREGPTVQICAGVASLLGRATALPPRNMRRLTPVGVAAGIAAAFNAPIAAVTFTIEEVVGSLDHSVLSGVVVAAAVAAVIERGVLGTHPIIQIDQVYGLDHASALLIYALLGIAAALVSMLFTDSLLGLRRKFRDQKLIAEWAQPAVGGLVTGVAAVVAMLVFTTGGVNGGGYEDLADALAGRLGLQVLLALCGLKLIATVFSYSSGGVGGIFAPTLFMGAMLGGAFGYLDVAVFEHETNTIGAFALVGMGAMFAGVIRAPITAVLIIFEMTGSYGLVLPLMLASTVSYAVARNRRPIPIYEALLEQDGIVLPQRGRRPHPLEQLSVADAMTADVVVAPADEPVRDAVPLIDRGGFALLPIVNDDGVVTGAVHARRIRAAVAAGRNDVPLGDLIQPVNSVQPDTPLLSAVVRMTELGVRQLVVTDREAGNQLVGILSMTDLVRAHARTAQPERAQTGTHGAVGADQSAPPETRAGALMHAAPVVSGSEGLHPLIDRALETPGRLVIVRNGVGSLGIVTYDQLRPFMRDEDLQKLLRASDVAHPAPSVDEMTPLPELVRCLIDSGASAAVVVARDSHEPLGIVTRNTIAAALLDWYAESVRHVHPTPLPAS